MEIIVGQPPRTILEVYDMLPEGTLAELIDNQIYLSPAPFSPHQKLVLKLANKLVEVVENVNLGEVIIAPFDVKLDATRNAVQPDITVILKSNPHQIINGRYIGIPDLVVEILSPGNREHDLVIKKALYEKFGVQEYWVVDPETKLALGYSLKEGIYHHVGEDLGKMQSPLLQAEFVF
jgi:Uma2 family endonuclease